MVISDSEIALISITTLGGSSAARAARERRYGDPMAQIPIECGLQIDGHESVLMPAKSRRARSNQAAEV